MKNVTCPSQITQKDHVKKRGGLAGVPDIFCVRVPRRLRSALC